MSADTERTRLLADYTTAVSEERALWKKMHDAGLGAVEVVQVYAHWKDAAERAMRLGVKLQTVQPLG